MPARPINWRTSTHASRGKQSPMHQPRPSSMRFQIVHATSYFYSEAGAALPERAARQTAQHAPRRPAWSHRLRRSARRPHKMEEAATTSAIRSSFFTIQDRTRVFGHCAQRSLARTAIAFTATEEHAKPGKAVSQACPRSRRAQLVWTSQFRLRLAAHHGQRRNWPNTPASSFPAGSAAGWTRCST